MLTRNSDLCFPGLNYNMAVTIMPDPFCNILLEESSYLSLSANRNLFELFIDLSKKLGVLCYMMTTLHLMSALMHNYNFNAYSS